MNPHRNRILLLTKDRLLRAGLEALIETIPGNIVVAHAETVAEVGNKLEDWQTQYVIAEDSFTREEVHSLRLLMAQTHFKINLLIISNGSQFNEAWESDDQNNPITILADMKVASLIDELQTFGQVPLRQKSLGELSCQIG